MKENNISQIPTKIIDQTNQELTNTIQEWINYLYTSKWGSFFSYPIFGIPIGNILGSLIIFIFTLLFKKAFARFLTNKIKFFTQKTSTKVDDLIIEALKKPLEALIVLIGFTISLKLALINFDFLNKILESLYILLFYWFLYRLVPPTIEHFSKAIDKSDRRISKELSFFISKFLKILIVALAILTILNNFGVNITAFVASLGLGGLAFALAAKDAAANLFGSIAILLDGSIKIDEWIRIDDIEGIVEDIGMRTTKIRTFEKSIIVIPNSIVANSKIENFSRRDVRRIKMFIGVTYDTTIEQLRKIVKDIKKMLLNHPGIAKKETLLVYFRDFNASDLGIFVYTFTNTANWDEYLKIREDINLKIIEIIQKNGSDFAFPSQSIYVEKLPQDLLNKE